ncbi:tRNA 2-selenouridine synthase [invertebrate metagenome]|uniref:tRNA 2-selenouridine synthase n=1 Tax=invertebrate metagenome TaxID=1711999 RepID=A0A2H9T5D6_9ZZZZ
MNQIRTDIEPSLDLFLKETPMMDVRAPAEFEKGSLPSAQNHPLLDNDQRHQIGLCYKRKGPEKAVALGYELATPEVRKQRINRWLDFTKLHSEGYIFCSRGGQRSHITQEWLAQAGCHYPLIKGGYKAIRQFLLEQMDTAIRDSQVIIVSGRTGSGKTQLLLKLDNAIDLEGLAYHRGSSFGRHIYPQPTQTRFENNLAIALLRNHHYFPDKPLLLEDESRLIGRNCLPPALRDKMKSAPLILLEEPMEHRLNIGIQEYVVDNLNENIAVLGEQKGFDYFCTSLYESLERIKKRLGGKRHKVLHDLMDNAIDLHRSHNDLTGYRPLIDNLLTWYYDPMYDYQLSKKTGKLLFRGTQEEILQHYPNIMIQHQRN